MAGLPGGFGRTPVKSIILATTEKKGVFVELSLPNWQGLLQPLIETGCLAQWKAYKSADVFWKAQMSTLFTTAPEPCKRNNWLVHLLSWAKYSSRQTWKGTCRIKKNKTSSASINMYRNDYFHKMHEFLRFEHLLLIYWLNWFKSF